jgi:ectoine hydroxylase-related dioxygenase (phytanoyl-CoA dioxygenase family)
MTNELQTPHPVSPAQVAQFQRDGFLKLKNVLSPATLAHYGRVISAEVARRNTMTKPMAARTTYEKAFLQIMNLWEENEIVREFVFSRRLARLAADLMGVGGVRLYHDQALYKEPGGGLTPWHADQYYWPLSTDNTVTVWIPLQPTPREMGPLAFSTGSHRYQFGRDLEISDESEQRISKELLERGLPQNETPFDLGEVSFHYGWTFHRAGANRTAEPRRVMTIIYMEDGCRVSPPKNRNQANDLARWMPGLKPGDLAASPLNPLLYSA